MLILAGVTINIVINGGLIGYAQDAKKSYTEAQDMEILQIAIQSYILDNKGNFDLSDFKDKINTYITEREVQTKDGETEDTIKVELNNNEYIINKNAQVTVGYEAAPDENILIIKNAVQSYRDDHNGEFELTGFWDAIDEYITEENFEVGVLGLLDPPDSYFTVLISGMSYKVDYYGEVTKNIVNQRNESAELYFNNHELNGKTDLQLYKIQSI